jgi:hypothetical protein
MRKAWLRMLRRYGPHAGAWLVGAAASSWDGDWLLVVACGHATPSTMRETPQNCRICAILLCWTDAEASRGQANFEEKRDVGARDENHRAYEQQRNGPRKT